MPFKCFLILDKDGLEQYLSDALSPCPLLGFFFLSVRNSTLAHHEGFLQFTELEKLSHGFTKTREMSMWK